MRIMKITDEWLAGFVDGEGWIGLASGSFGTPKATLTIGNTNLEALEAIQVYTGAGNVKPATNGSLDKPMWQWKVGRSADIGAICERLLPHLNVKWRQAELMIRWVETSDGNRGGPGRNERIASYAQERIEIYAEFKALNKRGSGRGYE
jgi:hypothetical protein